MQTYRRLLIANQEFGFAVDSTDWGFEVETDCEWNGDILRYGKVGPFALVCVSNSPPEGLSFPRALELRCRRFLIRLAISLALSLKNAASDSLRVSAGHMGLPPRRPRALLRFRRHQMF